MAFKVGLPFWITESQWLLKREQRQLIMSDALVDEAPILWVNVLKIQNPKIVERVTKDMKELALLNNFLKKTKLYLVTKLHNDAYWFR